MADWDILCNRKPTHMDMYLHARSEHHPSQKQAALKKFIHWARTICDAESLDEEINHLKKTFRQMDIVTWRSSRPLFRNRGCKDSRRSWQT
jgi:hypothetical protein